MSAVREFTIPKTVAELDALDPPDIFLPLDTPVSYLKPGFARRETTTLRALYLKAGQEVRVMPETGGCVYFAHVEDVPEPKHSGDVWIVLD